MKLKYACVGLVVVVFLSAALLVRAQAPPRVVIGILALGVVAGLLCHFRNRLGFRLRFPKWKKAEEKQGTYSIVPPIKTWKWKTVRVIPRRVSEIQAELAEARKDRGKAGPKTVAYAELDKRVQRLKAELAKAEVTRGHSKPAVPSAQDEIIRLTKEISDWERRLARARENGDAKAKEEAKGKIARRKAGLEKQLAQQKAQTKKA